MSGTTETVLIPLLIGVAIGVGILTSVYLGMLITLMAKALRE